MPKFLLTIVAFAIGGVTTSSHDSAFLNESELSWNHNEVPIHRWKTLTVAR